MKIAKALSLFTGVQGAGILCSIVRSKCIALWIGPTGVGLFAVFNAVLEMMSSATQLNLRQSAVRDISSSASSRLGTVAGAVRWWALRLGVAGCLLMLVLSPLLSKASFGVWSHWTGFALLSVAMVLLSVTSGEQALMQGCGSLRRLATSTFRGAVAGTLLSLPMYYLWGEDSVVPSLIVFAFTSYAATMYGRERIRSGNTRRENIATGRNFLRLGIYLTVSSGFTTLVSYVFVSWLTNRYSAYETGIYQAGYTILVRYCGIAFTALAMEFFPRISRIATRPGMASVVVSHESSLILYVLTPMLVALIGLADVALTLLYTKEFAGTLPLVVIGCAGVVPRVVSYCMAYTIIARGDGKTYIVTETLSDSIGLALNIVMFRYWGFTGLGVSYVLWYVVYTIIIWIVYRGYGMRLKRQTVTTMCVSAAMVCSAIALRSWSVWAVLPVFIVSLAYGSAGFRSMLRR